MNRLTYTNHSKIRGQNLFEKITQFIPKHSERLVIKKGKNHIKLKYSFFLNKITSALNVLII